MQALLCNPHSILGTQQLGATTLSQGAAASGLLLAAPAVRAVLAGVEARQESLRLPVPHHVAQHRSQLHRTSASACDYREAEHSRATYPSQARHANFTQCNHCDSLTKEHKSGQSFSVRVSLSYQWGFGMAE